MVDYIDCTYCHVCGYVLRSCECEYDFLGNNLSEKEKESEPTIAQEETRV